MIINDLSEIQAVNRALCAARGRTGKNYAVAVKAGKARIRLITRIDAKTGGCTIVDVTEWLDFPVIVGTLNGI